MKRLMMLMIAGALIVPAYAQFSPVQVTVQRVSKKKSEGDRISGTSTLIVIHAGAYSEMLALRITVKNTTAQPVNEARVRWGIAKAKVSGYKMSAETVYGKEETINLGSQETKVIETEAVEAGGMAFNRGDARGDKIRGHGVQVSVGGKVVWEEFVPPSVKKSFDNMRPVDQAAGQPDKPSGKSKKPKGK